MSDILKKNLSCILKHNDSLYKKLLNIGSYSNNYEIKTNLVGEYNLFVNGRAVHSFTGAIKEAKEIIKTVAHNDKGSVHTVYGIGLGYLVDEAVNSLKGEVIIYEPDVELLHFVLSIVDFSQNFNTGRLYVCSDKKEFLSRIYKAYKYNSKASLLSLDFYQTSNMVSFLNFKKWLIRTIELVDHNYKLQVKKTYEFFKSTAFKFDAKSSIPFLTDYKDVFKGQPAIIVSAGPSLNKNIEFLKKYKDNALVFCVGTALPVLYNNGIVPDFLNVIETVNTSVHYNLPIVKDISFIAESFTESSYLNMDFKRKFMTASLETDAARWYLEKFDREFVPFEAKGTVSYHALYCAYYLGCNPIILIGQDLAYSDGCCYAKGSKFDGLKCVFEESIGKYKIECDDYETFKKNYFASVDYSPEVEESILQARLKELNDNLQTVAGQNGEVLPTDSVYALFIDYIKGFASEHGAGLKLINSSVGGALIDGFETLSLDKACESYASSPLDKDGLFEIMENKKTNTNACSVLKNLKEDYKVYSHVYKIFKDGIEACKSLQEELEKNDAYTDSVKKLLDRLSKIYTKITNQYMQKYRIIKMITLEHYSELSYLTRENNFISTLDDAKKYAQAYYQYFLQGESKFLEIGQFLNDSIENLEKDNESSLAKS